MNYSVCAMVQTEGNSPGNQTLVSLWLCGCGHQYLKYVRHFFFLGGGTFIFVSSSCVHLNPLLLPIIPLPNSSQLTPENKML